jgi:undecaprenyl-diphosphatase
MWYELFESEHRLDSSAGVAESPMAWLDLLKALVLGLVEGLTQFIPVSAGGHLLLAQRFFGLGGGVGTMPLELGALLGLVAAYGARVFALVLAAVHDPAARRFVIGILIAVLPAAVLGVLVREFIVGLMLNIWVVCFALIVGGAILLWVDRGERKARYAEAREFSLPMYLAIGVAQCLALIPGVSRAGASIVAAMWLGADRRAATDFSLWLALPTLAGALAFSLYRNGTTLSADNALAAAIGLAAAFVAAWLVVRSLLDYVGTEGLRLFAWWRVLLGSLGLIWLALGR